MSSTAPKKVPEHKKTSCPVATLGREADSIIRQLNERDRPSRSNIVEREVLLLGDRLDSIAEAVSWLTATSLEGVSFQIVIVDSLLSAIANPGEALQDEARFLRYERRAQRLMENVLAAIRSMGVALPENVARYYLMPTTQKSALRQIIAPRAGNSIARV